MLSVVTTTCLKQHSSDKILTTSQIKLCGCGWGKIPFFPKQKSHTSGNKRLIFKKINPKNSRKLSEIIWESLRNQNRRKSKKFQSKEVKVK